MLEKHLKVHCDWSSRIIRNATQTVMLSLGYAEFALGELPKNSYKFWGESFRFAKVVTPFLRPFSQLQLPIFVRF